MPKGKGEKPTEIQNRYEAGFLDSMDGRAEVTRTLRQRLGELTSDLGGPAGLSYQERSIVRRIIHIERLIEKDELSMAHNGAVDKHAHFAAINTLTSLFSKIGMKRRAKQIHSLSAVLNAAKQPAPSSEPQTKENAPC